MLRRDVGATRGRDEHQEERDAEREHDGRAPADAADVPVVDHRAEEQRQEQRGREDRLDEHERADPERERLEHVAADVGAHADEPTRPVRELREQTELERLVLGELFGFVLLEHVAQRVRERGDDGAERRDTQPAD